MLWPLVRCTPAAVANYIKKTRLSRSSLLLTAQSLTSRDMPPERSLQLFPKGDRRHRLLDLQAFASNDACSSSRVFRGPVSCDDASGRKDQTKRSASQMRHSNCKWRASQVQSSRLGSTPRPRARDENLWRPHLGLHPTRQGQAN